MKLKDFKEGDVMGNWTLIKKEEGTTKYVKWLCKCVCGTQQEKYLHNLRYGSSCGCLNSKRICDGDSNRTEYRRLYNIFRGMLARCNNPNRNSFPRYGGKGIKVEFTDYIQFKNWSIESGYTEKHTIDRIDSTGNYAPYNCRWILPIEQSYNRTSNKLLNQVKIKDLVEEFDNTPLGKKKDLAKKYNCTYTAIKNIILNSRKGKYNEDNEFWA